MVRKKTPIVLFNSYTAALHSTAFCGMWGCKYPAPFIRGFIPPLTIGTASDVKGVMHAEQAGNTIHLSYIWQMIYRNKKIELFMDTWDYRIDEHVVLNNTTIRKFGIKVGRLITSFWKD